jgi:hypothetical protein
MSFSSKRNKGTFAARTRRIPLWKDGGVVQVIQRGGGLVFQRKVFDTVHDQLDPRRVFAVDTESILVAGKLTTDLVPMCFHDGGVLLDVHERADLIPAMLEQISVRFSVPLSRPSRTKQRTKRERRSGRKTRDGRRSKVPMANAVWFNMAYDLGRLFPDYADLRLIHSGVDSFTTVIDPRWSIEWERFIDGSAPQFTWFIRDRLKKRITKVVGTDVTGIWKTSLDKLLKTFGLAAKHAITDRWPHIHETPWEKFTPEMAQARREYALYDAKGTRDVHLESVDMLVDFDPRVVRRNGLAPPSAPGAAARMMFARSFSLHPDVDTWRGPPLWADVFGAAAYYGGRSACPEPGIATGAVLLDLKSCYPAAMALLPDPVDVFYRHVMESEGFDIERWRGRFGVMCISGESLDCVYPPFRIHDEDRLRYVYGRFENLAVTIPEIVIGVLRGALRVDRVHEGYWLDGSPEKSCIRDYVLDMYAIKEANPDAEEKPNARGRTAKLMINSPYGKTIEVQCQEIACESGIAVPDVRCHPRASLITASMMRCALASCKRAIKVTELWLGDTSIADAPMVEEARELFSRRLAKIRGADPDDLGHKILEVYCRTVHPIVGLDVPLAPLRDVVRASKTYKAGRYFMPAYGSQITGFASAQLGLMIACVGARACDTDSSSFVCPSGDPLQVPGVARYFEIMKASGYPAPRLDDPSTLIRDKRGLPTNLGTWAADLPKPSTESIYVRPKRYSHKYWNEKKNCFSYKQATHGMTRYQPPKIHPYASAAEAVHEEMRSMLEGKVVFYETRRAPRKGREAVRTRETVGEFVSHAVYVRNDPVPNTYLGADGRVRWVDLDSVEGVNETREAAE